MIMNMAGGGGAGLNFAVKAYASQDVLLSSTAKENTIGIITYSISKWCLSATEPQHSSENMVWIQVGISSAVAFNMLKKNSVYVYPVSVKQYVSGEWVSVYAYIRQNGKWVLFSEIVTDLYLYDSGDQCENVTGGWILHNNAEFKDSAISLRTWWTNGGAQTSTKNMIDVTAFDTLHVSVSESHHTSSICLLPVPVVSNFNQNIGNSSAKATIASEAGEYTVDVSDLEGSYYIWIGNNGPIGEFFAGCYVARVWLTKEGSSEPITPSTKNVATFNLNRNASTPVLVEIDGVTYGVENATVNEGPTGTTYDFTIL